MSLSLALNTALSGLNVNQKSLATLSQNIANANNPEYSRKIINQEAVYLQGTGAGVSIRDISRSATGPNPKHGMGRAIFGLIMGAIGTVVLILAFLAPVMR